MPQSAPKTIKNTPERVIDAFDEFLAAGEYDDRLEGLYGALRDRQDAKRHAETYLMKRTLRRGMKVRVKEDAPMRSKSLLGQEVGTVQRVNRTKVVVAAGANDPLYPEGTEVNYPIFCLEPVK